MTHDYLMRAIAQAKIDDLRRAAESRRPTPLPIPATAPSDPRPVTLRFALADDADALARLAAFAGSYPLAGPVLLAEVGGQLHAALSLADGTVIAHPLHPGASLIKLLRARANQLAGNGRRRRHPSLWLRPGETDGR